MKKKDNVLILKSGRRRVEVLLKDLEYVEQPPEYPEDLEKKYTSKVTTKFENLKSFLSDVHLVGGSEVKIETKKDKLTLYSKNLDAIEEQIEATITGEQTVYVGIPFIDAVRNLSGEVVMNIEEKHPVIVVNKEDDSVVKIIVAPLEM